MENMPYHPLQSLSGASCLITDSATPASSLNTSRKSFVNTLGVYVASGENEFGYPKVETIAEDVQV